MPKAISHDHDTEDSANAGSDDTVHELDAIDALKRDDPEAFEAFRAELERRLAHDRRLDGEAVFRRLEERHRRRIAEG